MQIDAEQILDATSVANVRHFELIDSTSLEAARRIESTDAALPLLIVASRQTAGYGCGENRWWTGSGALAMTLVLNQDAVQLPLGSPLLPLAVGVSWCETLASFLPNHAESKESPRLGLHWPNDIYLDGRKLAGILTERPARPTVLRIGVGMNTNNTSADAPEEIQHLIATWRDCCGATIDHTELLVDWLPRLDRIFKTASDRPTEVARRADALCLQKGEVSDFRDGAQRKFGRCLGIADDGGLRIETDGVETTLY